MSQPISRCAISKAVFGDQADFNWLCDAEEYNRTQIMFTVFPCECEPRCPEPSKEQLIDLKRRIDEVLEARRKKWEVDHPPRPIGDFSKWIFPVIKDWNVRRPLPWYRRFWNWLRRKPDPIDYDLRQLLKCQPMGKHKK